MFEIGQQVVCIIEERWICVPEREPTPAPFPLPKQVYTVSGLHEEDKQLFLILEEMRGAWWAKCFRPVRKTNIDVFTEILASPPWTVTKPKVDA